MREEYYKYFCLFLLEGFDALKYGESAKVFVESEGIAINGDQDNPGVVRQAIVDYLIAKTKMTLEGSMP